MREGIHKRTGCGERRAAKEIEKRGIEGKIAVIAGSKSGLITLTEGLREELKETQITVNVVMYNVELGTA